MTKEELLDEIYAIEDATAMMMDEYYVDRDRMMRNLTILAGKVASLEV